MKKKGERTLKECKSDSERAAFFENNSSFELLDDGLMKREPASTRYAKKPKKDQQLNIRVDSGLIESIKEIALEKGIAYQTLVRVWLQEKINTQKT